MADTFVSLGDALSGNTLTNIVKTSLENLKSQAPAVATALYLIGKDAIPSESGLLIWFAVALAAGIVIEIVAKKSAAVIICSAIAFLAWVWGMGGLFDGIIPDFLGPQTSSLIIAAYHIVITALADLGKIK
jgi:uncharacterized membrane protein YGL010W